MSLLDERAAEAVSLPDTAGRTLPRVNLLPPEIAERARLRRVQLGLGGGLLVVLATVTAVYAAAVGSVRDAGVALDASTARGSALQAETAKYADVQAVHDRAASAQAMLAGAMASEVRYSGLLHDLSRTVPEDVWLKQITFTQADGTAGAVPGTGIGTVTFSGVGFSHDDVAVWLESLGKQKGYSSPAFTESTAGLIGERRTVSFTSTATLTADALSRRFTATDGS